jgi:enamine deaminase RidA (YjgF/YER057c/UK114 family)
MNAVWDAWIVPGHTPPRATVIAPAINPDYRIEVIVTAAQIAAD